MPKGKKKRQEEVFHVEVITAARVSEDFEWEYYVKWAGYDDSADSWEPAGNVKQCVRLLDSFWKHIGTDNEDCHVGDTFKASPEWIIDERRFFQQEFGYVERKEKRKRHLDEQRKKEKSDSKKSERKNPHMHRSSQVSVTESSSTKDKAKAKPSPQTTRNIIQSSDDSEDEEPLLIKLPARKRKLAVASENEESNAADDTNTSPRKVSRTVESTDEPPAFSIDKGKQKARTPPLAKQRSLPPDSPSSLFSEEIPSPPAKNTSTPLSLANTRPTPTVSTSTSNVDGRKNSRGVKLINMAPKQVAAGSSLSTKQRIALGLQGPTSPKNKPAITLPKTSSLSSLNFKKQPKQFSPGESALGEQNAQVQPLVIQTQRDLASSAIIPSAVSQTSPTAGLFSDDAVTSPVDMDTMDYESFGPISAEMDTTMRSPSLPINSPVVDPMVQKAEDFLSTIMPAALAAPITEPTETPSSAMIPPKALPSLKSTSLQRIPKKWKWSGDLFLCVAPDSTERVCEVTITDTTDHLPEGLRFGVMFSSIKALRLQKLFTTFEVTWLLRACTPVQQLGKLTPLGDSTGLKQLTKYMTKEHKVASADMLFNDSPVGILLVFPPAMDNLSMKFNVPANMRQDDALVAALFAWKMSPKEYVAYDWHVSVAADRPALRILDGQQGQTLRNLPLYQHAIRVLKFPKRIARYMSSPNRPYCVWWLGGDGTNKHGLETKLLQSVLQQCGAKNVGHKADVRAVFVHVGALKTLHKLPAFAERRSKRFDVQFFSYGTHHSIIPERWGIHEIYPLGGIVTFTPNALLHDPYGVYKLVLRLVEHPLWDCYVLPSVIGMLAKLTCGDEDPLSVFDKGGFLNDDLLNLIEDGQLALLRAPPLERSALEENDPIIQWVSTQIKFIPLQTRGLLESCLTEFDERFSTLQKPEWTSAIEAEISQDLLLMQVQPTIMKQYRRYIVIKGPKDDHLAWDRDGFEWLSLSQFDFKDDFFETPLEIFQVQGTGRESSI